MKKVIFALTVCFILCILAAGARAGTIYVPDEWPTIGEAVSGAAAWDTIIVRDGEYAGGVNVNKPLTIRSESGPGNCILSAPQGFYVFYVSADYVSIEGFRIEGASYGNGVWLHGSGHSRIEGNIITSNLYGIYLGGSDGNTIRNNTVSSNLYGISLENSDNNTVENNAADSNIYGIYLSSSVGNAVEGNSMESNSIGIYMYSSSANNTIKGNTVESNVVGLRVSSSDGNTIYSNRFLDNYGDTAHCGISLQSSQNNSIYLNEFINYYHPESGLNICAGDDFAGSENTWNSPGPLAYTHEGKPYMSHLGNYWGDYGTHRGYVAEDSDGDGIMDNPYSVCMDCAEIDYYPLRELFEPVERYIIAGFEWSPETQNEGSGVEFRDTSVSYPGPVVSWSWSFWGNETNSEQNPVHTYGDNGVYVVALTVGDEGGSQDTVSHNVTILNAPPEVVAGEDREAYAGDTIGFMGNATDPGSDDLGFAWDWGDGTPGREITYYSGETFPFSATDSPEHTYFEKGNYTVTLAVEDGDGGTVTDTVRVSVRPISAQIDCDPDALNLRSRGRWITCRIGLPEGYDTGHINLSTVYLNGVPAYAGKHGWAEGPRKGCRDGLMVKFERSEVQETLGPGEEALLILTGKVFHNQGLADFEGQDIIRVINRARREKLRE